jgi:hypothetical protein
MSAAMAERLSALSGEECTHACIVIRRDQTILTLVVVLLIGAGVGALLHGVMWIVSGVVVALLAVVLVSFVDRRIVGNGRSGLVQADCSLFLNRPTEMYPAVHITEVEIVNRRFGTYFHFEGHVYRGGPGCDDVARRIQYRQRKVADQPK